MAITKTVHPNKLGNDKAMEIVNSIAARHKGVMFGFDLQAKTSPAVMTPGAIQTGAGIKVVDTTTSIAIPSGKASLVYFNASSNVIAVKDIPLSTHDAIYLGLSLMSTNLWTATDIPLYIVRDFSGVLVFDDVRKHVTGSGVNMIKSVVPGVLSYHQPSDKEIVMLGDGSQYVGNNVTKWEPLHSPIKSESKYSSLKLVANSESTSLVTKPCTGSKILRQDGTAVNAFSCVIGGTTLDPNALARLEIPETTFMSGRATVTCPGKQTQAIYATNDGKYLQLFAASSGVPLVWSWVLPITNGTVDAGTRISGYLGV